MAKKILDAMDEALCRSFFGANRRDLSPENLLNCFTVESKEGSDILYIGCLGTKPKECARIADLIADVFICETRKLQESAQSGVLNWLREQTPILQAKMEQQRRDLLEFEKENPEISFFFREKGNRADMVTRLEQELQDAEIKLASLEVHYLKYKDVSAKGSLVAKLSLPFLEGNQSIQQLRQKEFELENQLQESRLRYQDEHPQIVAIRESMKRLSEKISEEVEIILRRQEQDYFSLQESRDRLKAMYDREQKKNLSFKEKYVVYKQRQSEYEISEKSYFALFDRLKELDSTENYRVENIRVIDNAHVPEAPFYPNVRRNYLLSALLGLLVGVGIAFLLEMLQQNVKTPEEIPQILSASLIGFIPYLRASEFSGKIYRAVLENEKASGTEAFRSIATSLLMAGGDQAKNRCLLLTSPLPKDGKTIAASNLAMTLAKIGHSVLLVDADMHKASLSKVFELRKSKGLRELLDSEASLEDVAQKIADNLWLVPTGRSPKDIYEYLNKSPLESTIQSWREKYSYVILDTPPVGLTNDAFLLSRFVDGVLLLVALAQSSRKMLRHLSARFRSLEFALQGVIVNDTKGSAVSSSTGYNYYNYYGYYKTYYGEDARKDAKS